MHNIIICGSGIKAIAHLTQETIASIKQADKTLYLVNEPVIEEWIQKNTFDYESLEKIYFSYQKRIDSYQKITKYIIDRAKLNKTTCIVFYGHPCVFAQSALAAARALSSVDNYNVEILPGISAEDCLFADLKINPGDSGCQSYEATDFLLYNRSIDNRSHLILWQFGILGMIGHDRPDNRHVALYEIMKNKLTALYSESHNIVVYEASLYPKIRPLYYETSIANINADMSLTQLSSVYIPPIGMQHSNINQEVLKLLA